MRVDVNAATTRQVAQVLVDVPVELHRLLRVAVGTNLRPELGAGARRVVLDAARVRREDGERQGFATFATRAGSWRRFACPACQDAARAAARRLGEGDARASAAAELDVRDAFASFTAAESASAWEVLETCEAEARARGWKPAGEGGSA